MTDLAISGAWVRKKMRQGMDTFTIAALAQRVLRREKDAGTVVTEADIYRALARTDSNRAEAA
jgi:hypothetical protein